MAVRTPVVMVKVAEVWPASMITVTGGVIPIFVAEDQLIKITTPEAGAGAVRVKVAVTVWPPTTGFGVKIKLWMSATAPAWIRNEVVADALPVAPLTVTVTGCRTGAVVIRKSAVVCPAGTRTWLATDAAVWLTDKETSRPPAGAGAPIVTRPVRLVPPVTLAADTVMPTMASDGPCPGVIVKVPVEDPFVPVSTTTTLVTEVTTGVVKVTDPVVCPAGMVSVPGTVTPVVLVVSVTVVPDAEAQGSSR